MRLATTTAAPEAYALALHSCHSWLGATDDCSLLSPAQWARIEPDNAMPWLYLAAEAGSRHDRIGVEAALIRASKSGYSDPRLDSMSRFIASDAFQAQPLPVQPQLALSLLVTQAAFPLPQFQVPLQYCSSAAQPGPLHETCRDLASLLIEHGRTVMEVFIGANIAERAGSTDPRLSTLHDQADAMRWQLSQPPGSPDDYVLFTCDSLKRLHRDMAIRADLGESGLVRQKLAESGVTTAQAAQRWRADLERKRLDREDAKK